jgi:hypothetical protein
MRVAVVALLAVGCAATPPVASYGAGKQATSRHCTDASECELVPRSCCGHCGVPAPGDVRAVPAGSDRRPSRCTGSACPRCHAEPDPRLVATCTRAGECAVLDLTRSPLTACENDAQCVVVARDCCECGAQAWVAVRGSAADTYRERVCAADQACPDCLGQPVVGTAVCREHHCDIAVGRR